MSSKGANKTPEAGQVGKPSTSSPVSRRIILPTETSEETELTQRLVSDSCGSLADGLSAVEMGGLKRRLCSSDQDQVWRTFPLERFTRCLSEKNTEGKKPSRAVKEFYAKQDAHIRELEKLATLETTEENSEYDSAHEPQGMCYKRIDAVMVRLVFLVNTALLCGKAVASAISGSLSIISSLLDSCVDLASGGIMWYAARQMRKRRPYTYPQGRTRLEPIAIIVLSVFMSTLSLQILFESIETAVSMYNGNKGAPNVTNVALGLMASVVVTKIVLWAVCSKFGRSPAVRALKVDQRNDVFSNGVSILFSGLASRLPPVIPDKRFENLKYLDPIGAMLMSSYIIYSWYKIGSEQARNLAGHTADPRFLQKIAFVSLNHHEAIERLDTIRAFHFGCHFLVEVDIVLPSRMELKVAHDIGEGLQKKLEKLESVERAFVHLDYEFSHRPESEHKIA